MGKYNHKKIEQKWQKEWESQKLYKTKEDSPKSKFYVLDMFPYPSGDGLHVGHVESYTATDIYARYKRMLGYNVLHPMGWDAFGLPAENYAVKTGVHPKETTRTTTDTFRSQIKNLGLSYDWEREIGTHTPEYYTWTQWFFLLLYKNGLTKKEKAKVNWCDSCKTVLANEQVVQGFCERCKTEVIQKDLEQWFFKITKYADALIDDLDTVDWPESTKINQRNWIGRSEGAELTFPIKGTTENIRVFTTRPDTLYGATYMILSPEHSLVEQLKSDIMNWGEVVRYTEQAQKRTEIERTAEGKDKTGVELQGVKAINPATEKEIPIYIADYVLAHYGTGAIMAVPAHDERDYVFARRYGLPIRYVIEPEAPGQILFAMAIIQNKKGEILLQRRTDDAPTAAGKLTPFGGSIEKGESVHEALSRELEEELELDISTYGKNIRLLGYGESKLNSGKYFATYHITNVEDSNLVLHEGEAIFKVTNLDDVPMEERGNSLLPFTQSQIDSPIIGSGILVNSGEFNKLSSEEAGEKIIKYVRGRKKTTYKLRDWLVSRQRYWGAPIPIVYDPEGKPHPVPEKHLPWLLPVDVEFTPTGVSPLSQSKELLARTEKIFGEGWKPEVDTMDTFVCSSWYFFRFTDAKNKKEFASQDQIKKWLPVDIYVGGAEHTVLHLMYSRFFTKVLHEFGYVPFKEPFLKLRHQGMVLAPDGKKMSKSLGNVINPDDIVKQYGADAIRLYEMFMGPLQDAKPWNTANIMGVRRFLEKVWRLQEKVGSVDETLSEALEQQLHRSIQKIGDDIEYFKFNTAISQLMILVNGLEKTEKIPKTVYQTTLKLLAPFAPHMSEELWYVIGGKTSVHLESWPAFDSHKITLTTWTVVIQVNGKVRSRLTVSRNLPEDEIKKKALENESVIRWTRGEKPKKVIYIKGKIINIVI